MNYLIALSLALFVFFVNPTNKINAEDISIDDLLNPQLPSLDERIGADFPLFEKPAKDADIDEFLGPKDIFPFLPDNHRDSGTGKFNSF